MVPKVQKMITRAGEMHRRWLRYRQSRPEGAHLNIGALERNVTNSIYRNRAAELGLAFRELGPMNVIQQGSRRFHFDGVWTDFDTMPLCQICGDKIAVRDLLEQDGLKVPEGRAFRRTDVEAALRYTESMAGPVVIKPARGTSSGRGVAVNIRDQASARKALRFAGLFCDDILIERFVPGENYRFLIYKGICLSVVRRELPAVVGDGTRTVAELIRKENAARLGALEWREGEAVSLPLPSGRPAQRALARQGLDLDARPEAGRRVEVSDLCNYASGATYLEVLEETHEDLLRAAIRAAELLGLTWGGVDVISPDITRAGYVINEVNTTPGPSIHYYGRNRERMKDPVRTVLGDFFGIRPVADGRSFLHH